MRTERKITADIDAGKYGLAAVRYAAYAVSGSAYVFLTPLAGSRVRVELEPKPGACRASLLKRFRLELQDEKLRARVAAESAQLKELLLARALSEPPPPPPGHGTGLTPQQEKELDELIAEVEEEIERESASPADRKGEHGTKNRKGKER